MQKRGQIALFMIVGIVALLLVALMLMYSIIRRDSLLGHEAQQAIENEISLYPPAKYVDYCVNYHAPRVLARMAESGGTLFPQDYQSLWYDGHHMRVWYTQRFGNTVVSRKMIADELQESLRTYVDGCMDLRVYEREGYTVQHGALAVSNVTIGNDEVTVHVEYPIMLQKEDTRIEAETFSVQVDFPMGRLLQTAQQIVNTHAVSGYFDNLGYMLEKNLSIRVERHRPYPYIVYELERRIDAFPVHLRFAVEDNDPFSESYADPEGCCEIQGDCFLGALRETCIQNRGFYRESCVCGVMEEEYARPSDSMCIGGECEDCASAVHGESWCGSVSGVGGRHYREICLNGEIIQEECKDYRQEICVEQDGTGVRQARCRENLYVSCLGCTTQACCEDRDVRDCVWVSDILGCRPAAPPGLPFWQSDASLQCSMASVICDDCDVTADVMLESCNRMGDCGNQLNVYGEGSLNGIVGFQRFSNRDIIGFMDSLGPELAYDPQAVDAQQPDAQAAAESLTKLFASALQMLERLSEFSLTDYLDFRKIFSPKLPTVSYCKAWEAPDAHACEYCSAADIPCSEYLCRSLGKECMYATINGTGICFERDTADSDRPEVMDAGSPYDIGNAVLGQVRGFHIEQELGPQSPLVISFNMSEPTRCKPTYLPGKSFEDIRSFDLRTDASFVRNHTFRLRLVSDMEVFSRFLSLFNTTTYEELADELQRLKNQLEVLAREHPQVRRFKEGYYPLIAPLVEQYTDEEHREMIELLLGELDEGKYHVFFTCIDTAGNQNPDFFVSFNMQSQCEDEYPPNVLNVTAHSGQFTVSVDEWTTCRYDTRNVSYDAMEHDMACPMTAYDVNPSGVYACNADMPENSTHVYIICRDHPDWSQELQAFSVVVQQNGPGRYHHRIEGKNGTYTLNATEYGAQVEFPVQPGMTCTVDGEDVACSADICVYEVPALGEYHVVCSQPQVCDSPRNTGDSFMLALPERRRLTIQDVVTEDGSIRIRLEENASARCMVDVGDLPFMVDVVNGTGDAPLALDAGRYEAAIRCQYDQGMGSNDSVVLIV